MKLPHPDSIVSVLARKLCYFFRHDWVYDNGAIDQHEIYWEVQVYKRKSACIRTCRKCQRKEKVIIVSKFGNHKLGWVQVGNDFDEAENAVKNLLEKK